MVLHNIANDSELIKISTATLSSKRFFERDFYCCNVLTVPCRVEEYISEANGHQILNHFFPQVMIDSVKLIFGEQRSQMISQDLGAGGISSEGLLYNHSCPSSKTINKHEFEKSLQQLRSLTDQPYSSLECEWWLFQKLKAAMLSRTSD